jgi:hypothetical protein
VSIFPIPEEKRRDNLEEARPMSDSVRHLFPQLLANGYVPLANQDKVCRLKHWPRIVVDEAQCHKWTRQTRWKAIGLRAEPPLLVWDLDLPDEAIVTAVRAMLPEVVRAGLERVGNAPKTAFFLRLEGEAFHSMSTHRYLRGEIPFQVEVFAGGGSGKQIGAFGPHSHDDEGRVLREYRWIGDRSPANTRLAELPAMKADEVEATLMAIDDWLAAQPGMIQDMLVKRRNGVGVHEQKYVLDETMVFTDGDGETYTLDELTAAAKSHAGLKEDFRVTGSFLNEPGSKGSPRCRVRWSSQTGLSITDYKTRTTYRDSRALPGAPDLENLVSKFFGGDKT